MTLIPNILIKQNMGIHQEKHGMKDNKKKVLVIILLAQNLSQGTTLDRAMTSISTKRYSPRSIARVTDPFYGF